MVSRRQRKREKVSSEGWARTKSDCKAGPETNNCGELRVRWGGLCVLKGEAEHERVMVNVANRTWSPEDRERERKLRLGQDREIAKLDMRQTIVGICALDGEGYVH